MYRAYANVWYFIRLTFMSLFTTALSTTLLVLYESKYVTLNEEPHAHFLFQNHIQETGCTMSSELFVESSGGR